MFRSIVFSAVGAVALLASALTPSAPAATLIARTTTVSSSLTGGPTLLTPSHTNPQRPAPVPPRETEVIVGIGGAQSSGSGGGSTGTNSCNPCTEKRVGP
jgi:hypothetical protein